MVFGFRDPTALNSPAFFFLEEFFVLSFEEFGIEREGRKTMDLICAGYAPHVWLL
jgi:hypothetical protein